MTQTLARWLHQEPFTLAMSSGFFGFFAHCGMLAALEEEGIFPAALAGSSAGALVGGAAAAGLSALELKEALCGLRRQDFWDAGPGLGLLRGELFAQRLGELLPVGSFEQCPRSLTVSTFDILSLRTRVLTEGALAPAIQASCSVPLLFQPVWIGGRPCWDGGVADRPGLAGVEAERILFHHLAARSPWRLAPPAVPRRPGLTALVLEGLVRVNPFRLERGVQAFEQARDLTRRVLHRPMGSAGVLFA